MDNTMKVWAINIHIESPNTAATDAFADLVGGSVFDGEDAVFIEFESPIVTSEDHIIELAQVILTHVLVPASKQCNCKLGEFWLSASSDE